MKFSDMPRDPRLIAQVHAYFIDNQNFVQGVIKNANGVTRFDVELIPDPEKFGPRFVTLTREDAANVYTLIRVKGML